MTEPQRARFDNFEQVLSSDLNRVGSLAGRAAMDTLIGLSAGVDLFAFPPANAVREGLDATPGPALNVTISPGDVLYFEAGIGPDATTSRYKIGRLDAPVTVELPGGAPGANPRIDLVYGMLDGVDAEPETRNKIDPITRAVSPSSINTMREPRLLIGVATGSESATPLPPGEPGGAVPLWFVYVPTAAGTIDPNHLMDARRYLRANDVFTAGSSMRTPMVVGADPASPLNVRLPSGIAQVAGGGLAVIDTAEVYALADVVQATDPPVGANEEVDLYLVTRGNGVPVGKGEPNGVVLTGTTTNRPPLENGQPFGGGVRYYPLFSQGLTNVVYLTNRATYVGTVSTGAIAGQLEPLGAGLPLDRGGATFAAAIAGSGLFPATGGLLRKPQLRWFSASVAKLEGYDAVVRGVPTTAGADLVFDLADPAVLVGAENPSTWYYAYLRTAVPSTGGPARSPVRRLVPKLSDEPPGVFGSKPTPEASFLSEEYVYVGCVYNNAASDLEPFYRSGDLVLWKTALNGAFLLHAADVSVSSVITGVTAIVPGTSRLVRVALIPQVSVTAGAGDVALFVCNGALTDNFQNVGLDVGVVGGGAAIERGNVVSDVAVDDPIFNPVFGLTRSADSGVGFAFTVQVHELGFFESVEGVGSLLA